MAAHHRHRFSAASRAQPTVANDHVVRRAKTAQWFPRLVKSRLTPFFDIGTLALLPGGVGFEGAWPAPMRSHVTLTQTPT
jgi:hypothetical protein